MFSVKDSFTVRLLEKVKNTSLPINKCYINTNKIHNMKKIYCESSIKHMAGFYLFFFFFSVTETWEDKKYREINTKKAEEQKEKCFTKYTFIFCLPAILAVLQLCPPVSPVTLLPCPAA